MTLAPTDFWGSVFHRLPERETDMAFRHLLFFPTVFSFFFFSDILRRCTCSPAAHCALVHESRWAHRWVSLGCDRRFWSAGDTAVWAAEVCEALVAIRAVLCYSGISISALAPSTLTANPEQSAGKPSPHRPIWLLLSVFSWRTHTRSSVGVIQCWQFSFKLSHFHVSPKCSE